MHVGEGEGAGVFLLSTFHLLHAFASWPRIKARFGVF